MAITQETRLQPAIETEVTTPGLTGVSIGLDTVIAYGYVPSGPVYVESNFATPADVALSGIVAADEPAHEASLAATSLRAGEIGLIPKQVPGAIAYWQKVGMIPEGAGVEEVELHHEGREGFHFPHTDVVQQSAQSTRPLTPGHLVSSFPHQRNKEAARAADLHVVQPFEANIVGDKGTFHQAVEQYGFPASYAAEVYTPEDVERLYEMVREPGIAELFADRPQHVWVKLRNSSGGEGVGKIENVNTLSLEEFQQAFRGISERFYYNAKLAFANGGRRDVVDRYWDRDSAMPKEGLIVELDTNAQGESDGNSYSNILQIDADGTVREVAEFVQLVGPDGKFLGSSLSKVINKPVSADSAMGRIGRYFYDLGVRGSVGTDYKRVHTTDGLQIVFIDPNVRPSMSHHALIAYENIVEHAQASGQEICESCFANTVLRIPGGIRSIDDILQAVGEYAYDGSINMERGIVAPIGIGSYVTDGEIVPSFDTRVLIIGKTPEHCAEIIQELKRRGL